MSGSTRFSLPEYQKFLKLFCLNLVSQHAVDTVKTDMTVKAMIRKSLRVSTEQDPASIQGHS